MNICIDCAIRSLKISDIKSKKMEYIKHLIIVMNMSEVNDAFNCLKVM